MDYVTHHLLLKLSKKLVEINDHEEITPQIFDIVQNRLVHQSVTAD